MTKASFKPVVAVRNALWPAMGWRRLVRYLWVRLTRLNGSPHAIALGAACGVFSSFTPFMGFHIAFAMALAFLLGGNLIAAGLGTLVGNPLSFPLIWMATYNLGAWVLGAPGLAAEPTTDPSYHAWVAGSLSSLLPVLVTMTIGALPLGLVAAVFCYVPLRLAVAGLRRKRRQRVADAAQGRGDTRRPAVHPA